MRWRGPSGRAWLWASWETSHPQQNPRQPRPSLNKPMGQITMHFLSLKTWDAIIRETYFTRFTLRDLPYKIYFTRFTLRDTLYKIYLTRFTLWDLLYEIQFMRYTLQDLLNFFFVCPLVHDPWQPKPWQNEPRRQITTHFLSLKTSCGKYTLQGKLNLAWPLVTPKM